LLDLWLEQLMPLLLAQVLHISTVLERPCLTLLLVEMFKVRMQGQYGAKTDKRLKDVAKEMWSQWGFRKGVMRGYWVSE
jgi:hypothetical protein